MAIEEANVQATLQDEALEELGLSGQPFIDDKTRSRFNDATSQKVRATLEQHLRFGDSLHLFLGEQGAGKTVFLSQLIKHCKTSIKPFVAKGQENFEAVAFLAAVLNQLGGDETESTADHVDALVPLFEKLANDEQMSVVLAIDDAHLAPIEEIAELIDIMPSFASGDNKNARLLLTGESQLNDELAAIADEFDAMTLDHATTTLFPLDETRIRDYLTTRLNQVGHTDVFPFTDKAITKIHRESRGLPANINQLAAKYLNTVYTRGAAIGGKGFLAALGWPLMAMGAAAVGLIAWGLSMFFGNNGPATPTVAISQPVAEESVVATSSAEPAGNVIDEETDTKIMASDTAPLSPIATTDTPAVTSNEAGSNTDLAAVDDGLVLPEDRATSTSEEDAIFDASALAAANASDSDTTNPVEPTASTADEAQKTMAAAEEVIESVTESTAEAITQTESAADNISASAAKAVSETVPSVDTSPIEEVPSSVAVPIENPLADNQQAVVPEATPDPIEIVVEAEQPSQPADSDAGIVVQIEPLAAVSPQTTATGTAVPLDSIIERDAEPVPAPFANRAVENERWVLFQEPTSFTVQLATSKERNYIIDLAKNLKAEEPVAIYPFLTSNSNNPVFGLLSGLYKTRTQAIQAVEKMDASTKQFGVWIRPISDLQADIKKQP